MYQAVHSGKTLCPHSAPGELEFSVQTGASCSAAGARPPPRAAGAPRPPPHPPRPEAPRADPAAPPPPSQHRQGPGGAAAGTEPLRGERRWGTRGASRGTAGANGDREETTPKPPRAGSPQRRAAAHLACHSQSWWREAGHPGWAGPSGGSDAPGSPAGPWAAAPAAPRQCKLRAGRCGRRCGAMRAAGRLGSGAALWLLLAAQAVAAIEPISVGIAIGAASVITGYLSYRDLYCRFAECCREQRPLNATGRRVGGWAWRGARAGPRGGGRGRWGLGRDPSPGSRASCRRQERPRVSGSLRMCLRQTDNSHRLGKCSQSGSFTAYFLHQSQRGRRRGVP